MYWRVTNNKLGQFVHAPLPLFTKQYKLVLAAKLGSKGDVFHVTPAPWLKFNRYAGIMAQGLVGDERPRQPSN